MALFGKRHTASDGSDSTCGIRIGLPAVHTYVHGNEYTYTDRHCHAGRHGGAVKYGATDRYGTADGYEHTD